MKKLIAFFLASLCVPLALAAANEKEMDRVKDSGVVLKEILGIPDDIPKDLLDRAECVIVLPSVKKLAIGIGGSYGRGVMVCRNGEHFTGSWGAPAMYALEGGNIGFQLGGQTYQVTNGQGVATDLTRVAGFLHPGLAALPGFCVFFFFGVRPAFECLAQGLGAIVLDFFLS